MTKAARVLAVLLLATISPVYAQDDSDSDSSLDDIPHITMVGTARTEVAPDIATITLGVTTEKPSAAAAANENAQKAQAVIDAAKAQGIAKDDIATRSLTLTQTFDEVRDPDGRVTGQKPRGFLAENIVAIRVHDLAKAGTLAEAMITKGANRFDGISFAVEHPDPIVERLTGEAVKNARALALSAAQAAGVKLGRVLLIERPGGGEPLRAAPMRMTRAAPANVPIEAGTSSFETSVEVTWAIDGN